jgi:hypothetical protein
MRLVSELLAGASAFALLAACATWGAEGVEVGRPTISVGYLGAGALAAALALAIDGRRA